MDKELIQSELQFKAVRSSGAGGQHVNKVASKIELMFDLEASLGLTDDEKTLLKQALGTRLSKTNVLLLQCDESRSQHNNKALVTKRFFKLLEEGLTVQKPRIPTKVPRSAIRKRLKDKRRISDKKTNRKPPKMDGGD